MNFTRLALTIAVILFITNLSVSQSCDLVLQGRVIDQATGEGLEYANVFIEEYLTGAVSDSTGHFYLEKICPGEIHLRVSHVGCGIVKRYLDLRSDTFLSIELDHHSEVLHNVNVYDKRNTFGEGQSRAVITEREIMTSHSNSVAELASNIPGVTALSTGPGISKPVIHGLYGQRIALVQDGLNLAGQRWGNDHAPEVAIGTLNSIEVVKGVSALQYGAEGLGGTIVMRSRPINRDPHVHGNVLYDFNSNGLRSSLSANLQGWKNNWGWSAYGGGNIRGDLETPDYFLTNTSGNQVFGGADVEVEHKKQWLTRFNYRFYHDNSGVLRGSHLSSVEDLEAAFNRDVPFFTNEERTWQPQAPRQEVTHHVLGVKSSAQLQNDIRIKLKYGAQLNQRREFDIRRGGRTDIPSLDLTLHNHQGAAEMIWDRGSLTAQAGGQINWSANTNDPQSGISPLIPDYNALSSGLFSTVKYSGNSFDTELGIRYDHRYLSVAITPTSAGADIERFRHRFHNVSASLGASLQVNDHLSLQASTGYVQRQPHVNELYSNGLHQGVAGIEEGNRELNSEIGSKSLLGFSWHSESHILLEGQAFYQHIQDYIFLRPTGESRLTIRGAFPVFHYEQTNAQLVGVDLKLEIPISHHFKVMAESSYLNGRDLEQEQALIYMPQNTVKLDLGYDFSIGQNHGTIDLGGQYFFEQLNFPEDQVLIEPPKGYLLVNMNSHYEFSFKGYEWAVAFAIDNVLNARYRNYLNRNRFFADELGINFKLGINWSF